MAHTDKSFCLMLRFLFFSYLFGAIESHSCSHSIPKRHEVVHHVHIEAGHILRKRSIDSQLRIHTVYSRSVDELSEDKRQLVKDDLIPSAVSFWENTLQVRHTVGPIRLLRQCTTTDIRYKDGDPYPYCVAGCQQETRCGEVPVPDDHLEACRVAYAQDTNYQTIGSAGNGVDDSDFILYVSAVDSSRCAIGSTVAYAAYCQLEAAMDRPVAGYVNLCPEAISPHAHDLHQMHSTFKHEILHALGFSAGLFAFFRDDSGNPLTHRFQSTGNPPYNETLQMYQWSDKVVRHVVRQWKVRTGTVTKHADLLVTPRVVDEVRKHFGCTDLEGAELEDQGQIGTALTHWEKRIFENEMMTGTYTQNPMVSRITLALMEDTGWYRANYDNAEPLQWGKNLGCDFAMKSCLAWMEIRESSGESIHPYCNRVKESKLQTECTQGRDAVALCNLVEYTEILPNKYQHFTQIPGVRRNYVDRFGGSVFLADYCPYIQEFNWKDEEVVVRGSKCNVFENNADPTVNYALEKYGNTSKCFEHALHWTVKQCSVTHNIDEHWGSGCHEYECDPLKGLIVVVQGHRYRCYKAGQVLHIAVRGREWLHSGTIVCPSCQELCSPRGVLCPPEVSPPEQLFKVPPSAPCPSSTQPRSPHSLLALMLGLSYTTFGSRLLVLLF